MIILVGTSHVSARSAKDVKAACAHADLIAVELDANRASGILSTHRASFAELRAALGLKAALIASLLRSVQENIGEQLGIKPGSEMKTAILQARDLQKPIAFIDRDIRVTMQRLAANIGRREIWQLVKDLFRRRKISAHPSDDLVAELMAELKQTYPRIYRVMVAERDVYMAKALVALHEKDPSRTIVTVVGKGHVPGLLHQINYLNDALDVQVWPSVGTKSKLSSS